MGQVRYGGDRGGGGVYGENELKKSSDNERGKIV